MALIIENRGRLVTLPLPATILKSPQVVKTTRLDRATGKRTVITKRKVFGGALTIPSKTSVSTLPNGRPIPDIVGRLDLVRSLGRQLRVKTITDAEWRELHKTSSASEEQMAAAEKAAKKARAAQEAAAKKAAAEAEAKAKAEAKKRAQEKRAAAKAAADAKAAEENGTSANEGGPTEG